MLLQGLADHLGRELRLQVLVVLDLLLLGPQLQLVGLLHGGRNQLLLGLFGRQVALQSVALLLDGAQRLGQGQLGGDVARGECSLQPFDLGVLGRELLLELVGNLRCRELNRRTCCLVACLDLPLEPLDLGVLLGGALGELVGDRGLGQLDGRRLLPLGHLELIVQRLVEFSVSDLLDDVGVAGLVDREGLVAMWADDLVHWFPRFRCVWSSCVLDWDIARRALRGERRAPKLRRTYLLRSRSVSPLTRSTRRESAVATTSLDPISTTPCLALVTAV